MRFEEIKYVRPIFEEIKFKYKQYIDKLENSINLEEAISIIDEFNLYRNEIETMKEVSSIRYSLNTEDDFYSKEKEFWDEYLPLLDKMDIDYYNVLLNSKYSIGIEEYLGKQFFDIIKCKVQIVSDDIIDLLQEENKLMSEYTNLLSSCKKEFKGKICNLSQLMSYSDSLNCNDREDSIRIQTEFFEENEDKFDSIFDSLVKVRDKIAKKLGFDNFVKVGYLRMLRTNYNEADIVNLREKVKSIYVPLVEKLIIEQKERISSDKINFYNEKLEYVDGNAKLIGNTETILKNAYRMYSELSCETKDFYKLLLDKNLMDVESKLGKSMGGYCTILNSYKVPFIFGNFNGSIDDIDTLTHEFGHAFQVYMSNHINNKETIFPTLDSCEIHSMTMEYLTYPWMELFFGYDTEKYKKIHSSSLIKFIPYGTLVDEFQHIIYKNTDLNPDERKKVWRDLEKEYMPYRDYSDLNFLDKGTYWYRQGHIFKDPFYYIDYVLAQFCALQFKELMEKDYEEAWRRYIKICKIGGLYSFKEIVKMAGLKSPFE